MGMIYSTYLVMITHREGVDGAGDVTNVIDAGGVVFVILVSLVTVVECVGGDAW